MLSFLCVGAWMRGCVGALTLSSPLKSLSLMFSSVSPSLHNRAAARALHPTAFMPQFTSLCACMRVGMVEGDPTRAPRVGSGRENVYVYVRVCAPVFTRTRARVCVWLEAKLTDYPP